MTKIFSLSHENVSSYLESNLKKYEKREKINVIANRNFTHLISGINICTGGWEFNVLLSIVSLPTSVEHEAWVKLILSVKLTSINVASKLQFIVCCRTNSSSALFRCLQINISEENTRTQFCSRLYEFKLRKCQELN